MKQIIYADMIFLLNFCMDFLALFAAGKILGLRLSAGRLVLSSVFGAAYCVFTFICDYSSILEMIINILVSVIMCFIAYNINSLVSFTKIFVIFYSACFMLGGGIEALYYLSGLVNTEDIVGGSGANASPPFQTIIIFAGFCTLIVIFAGSLFKRHSSVKDTEIIVGFMGREVKIASIVDSGNLLYEPISSVPVIIVTLKSAANLFDMDTIEFFAGDSVAYLNKVGGSELEKAAALKFRIVPVKSVMEAKNILPAFTPDYIRYRTRRTKSETEKNISEAEDIKDMQNKKQRNEKKDGKHKEGKYLEMNAIIAVDSKNVGAYGEKYGGIVPAALIDI